jgi:hypothetical protein
VHRETHQLAVGSSFQNQGIAMALETQSVHKEASAGFHVTCAEADAPGMGGDHGWLEGSEKWG